MAAAESCSCENVLLSVEEHVAGEDAHAAERQHDRLACGGAEVDLVCGGAACGAGGIR